MKIKIFTPDNAPHMPKKPVYGKAVVSFTPAGSFRLTRKACILLGATIGDKIVVSGGTLDISGATVTLLDPSNIGEFIFIESINGGSVTGTPTVDTDTIPSPWKVLLSGDRAKITKSGIAIFIR